MKKITGRSIRDFKDYLISEEKSAATVEKYIRDLTAFSEWITDETFDSEFDFSTRVTEDITLYAKWLEGKADEHDGENKDDEQKPVISQWKNPYSDVKEEDCFF